MQPPNPKTSFKLPRSHALRSTFSLAFCAAFALTAGLAPAQTWQTVDDFQYALGNDAANYGLAFAPNGVLFASGYAFDAAGSHALVMASPDGGLTWSSPLDDFVGPTLGDDPYGLAVNSDPAGNIYTAGTYTDAPDPNLTDHWFVRRSTDGGTNWQTVDDVAPFSGSWFNQANAIASDAMGNVFVAGYLNTGPGIDSWGVRKGVGGRNFITVDTLSTSGLIGATAIFVHPAAGVFSCGLGPIATTTDKRGRVITTYGWLVRRSTDGGATWSSVDKFMLSSGSRSLASGIGADALGNIYVVGYGSSISGKGAHTVNSDYWIVRKSTNGGASWNTVDSYQLAAGHNSAATAFTTDSNGNLYAAGWANDATQGSQHWIVRENSGGTSNWSTVDDFQYVPGSGAGPAAIAANGAGNVFVGGWGGANTGEHWLVRRK
jgi:hypothetical protein